MPPFAVTHSTCPSSCAKGVFKINIPCTRHNQHLTRGYVTIPPFRSDHLPMIGHIDLPSPKVIVNCSLRYVSAITVLSEFVGKVRRNRDLVQRFYQKMAQFRGKERYDDTTGAAGKAKKNPLVQRVFVGGRGGIRTHGRELPLQRFSKPPH